MKARFLGLVLASLAMGGCASRGDIQTTDVDRGAVYRDCDATGEAESVRKPSEKRPPLAERVADRVAGGLIGAAMGALIGLGAAASIANADPNGTVYVSYVTVPLFVLAGLGTGLTNGAANTAPAMLQGMPLPMPVRVGFRRR